MVFSSYLFVFWFLPLTLLLYYAGPKRARHLLLTLLSYVFYGWANPWFVLLMLFSTVVDFAAGKIICAPEATERKRRFGVAMSVIVNLSLLGFFKYLGFVETNLNVLLSAFGRPVLDVYRVTLPVGISFYTFQSMSYSIDLYRGHARPTRSFLDFACYVALFPQLVAGPIVRYHELAEQLRHREHSYEKFAAGVLFFTTGLAKKVLLANSMGELADAAFGAGGLEAHQAWFGAMAYAFQIYFDFSGYSDMAVGLGRMFGFELPRNFAYPYRSESFTEFWRRWHISLSTWLRDYLYIPLGGNRHGTAATYRNLVIVMLLGGLWHGAEWTFVVWGALHGSFLIAERLIGKQAFWQRAPRLIRVAITFGLLLVTWVVFRAETLPGAVAYLGAMAGHGDGTPLLNAVLYTPYALIMASLCAFVVWAAPDTWELFERPSSIKALLTILLLFVAAAVMLTQSYNPFLYFRF